MYKYTVNVQIDGYENVDISDSKLTTNNQSLIIVALDSSTSDQLYTYYIRILDILMSDNKLIVIMINNESKIRKPICTLMASYRCYNMYTVESIDAITTDYADTIVNRNPTYEEVQTFVGGDITAYAEINAITLGIESLIDSNDIDGLKVFIQEHLNSISNFTEVVDYLKRVADSANSGELQTKIKELKSLYESAQNELEDSKKINKDIENKNVQLIEDLDGSKKDLTRALSKIDELSQNTSKQQIIKTYTSINTALIKNKVKCILYFKEITPIPYINSFVAALFEIIKRKNLQPKLVIYDNKNSFSNMYSPLNVINSTGYLENRDGFASKIHEFVVVEPNPIILEDILTHNNPAYDIVIIYDRMKQSQDLIVGNTVYKFYVINSNADFKAVQHILNITDKSRIITRSDSSIGSEVLDIPFISDYSGQSIYAKCNKYIKIATAITKKPLVKTVFETIRLDSLIK